MGAFRLRKSTGGSTLKGNDLLRQDIPPQTIEIEQALETDTALDFVADYTIEIEQALETDTPLEFTAQTIFDPVTPRPRKRSGIPVVTCLIDDREVPLGDWQASTVAHGGDDTLTGKLPEDLVRARHGSIEQEAPLVLVDGTSTPVWEGALIRDPDVEGGQALVTARGPMHEAEELLGRFLFQNRGTELWKPDGLGGRDGQGLGEASASGGLSASVGQGELVFRGNGSIASGAKAGVMCYVPTAALRRLAGTCIAVSGTIPAEINVLVYTCQGPGGTRTQVDNSGLPESVGAEFVLDEDTSPGPMLGYDTVVIQMQASGATSGDFEIRYSDVRVNDLAPADTMEPAFGIVTLADLLGWDTGGVDGGTPFRGLASHRVFSIYEAVNPSQKTPAPSGGTSSSIILHTVGGPSVSVVTGTRPPPYKFVGDVHEVVEHSGLNILPQDFQGSAADLMGLFADIAGWRWRRIPGSRIFEVGPWGPARSLEVPGGVLLKRREPRYNRVEVHYKLIGGSGGRGDDTVAGVGRAVRDFDPDPFEGRRTVDGKPIRRAFRFTLPNEQKDDALAVHIANVLEHAYSRPRFSAQVEVLNTDSGSPFHVRAGDLAVADVGDLYVSQTSISPNRVMVGLERPVSVAGILALSEKAAIRGATPIVRRNLFRGPT